MKTGRLTDGLLILSATALAVGSLTACRESTAPSSQPTPLPAAVVKIVTDPATIGAYAPAVVTINAGQEIEWDFVDLNPHTVSADPGSGGYSSRESAKGKTFRHRFDKVGTYSYHCAIHPEMHGIVTVN